MCDFNRILSQEFDWILSDIVCNSIIRCKRWCRGYWHFQNVPNDHILAANGKLKYPKASIHISYLNGFPIVFFPSLSTTPKILAETWDFFTTTNMTVLLTMVTVRHPLLIHFIHLHPLVSTCIHLCPLASTCIHLYPFSSTFIYLHPLVSTFSHLHPPASTCIHLHPLASTSTCIHLHPLVFICIHVYPCVSTCIHLYPLSSTGSAKSTTLTC